MTIYDYASDPPGVETPGYRLKPVKTGSGADRGSGGHLSGSRLDSITRFNGFKRLAWGFNPRCGDVAAIDAGLMQEFYLVVVFVEDQ
jgi:hypothetical protein